MQNLTDREEYGCFVYRMANDAGVAVRSAMNTREESKTSIIFNKTDLVSVDLIRPSPVPGDVNGPYLGLSDRSGWLFERKRGALILERIPVEKGLWSFYVDNFPGGLALRCHPFSGSALAEPKTVYLPMQLVYCDRKVVSPDTKVSAYRVQGTNGWVFDTHGNGANMLISEHKIRMGLYAYEVAEGSSDISLYSKPSTSEEDKLPIALEAGEIVLIDLIRESPFESGNGPFLRLNDGWGWMYEQLKNNPNQRMRQLPIEEGSWTLQVANEPHGIKLRRHPLDRYEVGLETILLPGYVVTCDRRIRTFHATTFYRVAGGAGWVFDLRGSHVMMRPMTSSSITLKQEPLSPTVGGGWSIDFVRGVALVYDLTEVSLNMESKVISFRSDSDERVNVFFATKTVGISQHQTAHGKAQIFRRNCSDRELKDIMQNPGAHTSKGHKIRSDGEYLDHYLTEQEEQIDEEEDHRNKLLEFDLEEQQLAAKKMKYLRLLKVIDEERARVAGEAKAKVDARNAEFIERKMEAEGSLRRRRLKREEGDRRKRYVCSECKKIFADEHELNQHYLTVHSLICSRCYRQFHSRRALYQHKEALGHF